VSLLANSNSKYPLGTVLDRYDNPLPPLQRPVARSTNMAYDTTSGSVITEDSVMGIAEILTCVRVIAESVATLPLDINRYEGKTIEKAVDYTLYDIIRWQPNPEMTSYDLRFWMMVDALQRGRGCAQIRRNGRGDVIEVWPLLASRLRAMRAPRGGRLVYVYNKGGKATRDPKKPNAVGEHEVMLEADEVFIFHAFYHGGLFGPSFTELQKDHFGSAKAADDFSAEYFANGGIVSGIVKVKEQLSEVAYQRLKRDWAENHTKKGKRHGVPILEQGAEFDLLNPNPEESQLLETRKYKRSTIAGLFRVPAHLINDLEKATFSNVEHLDLSFVKHCLRPWLTNIEQRCSLHFLRKAERKVYYFKHNTRDLLRGDLKTRMEAYASGVQNGIFSPNDCREAEDLNPYKGGEKYLVNGTLRDINVEPATVAPSSTTKK
jgi:HK97 family phage portal protein